MSRAAVRERDSGKLPMPFSGSVDRSSWLAASARGLWRAWRNTQAVSPSDSTPRSVADLSDEDLNRYVLTRLAIVGVDLSVLPKDDPEAPADRVRILRSARAFLRATVSPISQFELDPGSALPTLYPPLHPLSGNAFPDAR